MQCLKNAESVQSVSVFDRAFHYGDGCFTTGRIRQGEIELKAFHIERLAYACEKLFLNVNLSLIEQSIEILRKQNECLEGTFKIVISRGEGLRGYSLPSTFADLWLYYYPKNIEDFQFEYIQAGVLTQKLGQLMPNLVGIKSLNRLEQVLLKAEADSNGWAEALVIDTYGRIIEGVSSNCFMQIDRQWVTPELRFHGVHGIMRKEILKRMQQFGISCEIRPIDFKEMKNIQSLFFCNALSPMKVVSELSSVKLEPQACIDLFHHLQLNQIR